MNLSRSQNGRCLARCALVAFGLAVLTGLPAGAENQNEKPSLLRSVGIDQKLNEQLPLDLTFRDETGSTVQLGEFFGDKPVILALVYYECPMLCTQELNGLLRSLQNIPLDIGKQFNVVTVSFNPRETPGLAANKKKVYVGIYGRPGASEGWHFLTGDEAMIQKLTSGVGYHYAFDPASDQYAHATAIMVLTPRGKLSRYFYGIDYPSRDLRLSLVEASNNKIGSPVDQVFLYCYHYDPATGKYGLIIANVLRIAGSVTILVLGGFLWMLFRHERRAGPIRQLTDRPVRNAGSMSQS
ncbi:MAG TPA: SCO family protein [Terriglobia bacterium]|nr:SCO family protein [Terriglobia bacterium]